jgi:hypothetical protein
VILHPEQGRSMPSTVIIEIPASSEALVRQLLAMNEELQTLALSAPEGTVLDACETAILKTGRELNQQILADAVARRIETVEKKGRRSAPVPAVGPKRIAGARPVNS